MDEFNCLKATKPLRRQFTFCHQVARSFWYSFDRPWQDESLSPLSPPLNQPLVMNAEPLDWEY